MKILQTGRSAVEPGLFLLERRPNAVEKSVCALCRMYCKAYTRPILRASSSREPTISNVGSPLEPGSSIFIPYWLNANIGMAAAKSRRKQEVPSLTEKSIKQGIEELEERKGKKFKSVEEMLAYVDKMPDD